METPKSMFDTYNDLKKEIKDLDEMIESVAEEIRSSKDLEDLELLIEERDSLLYEMIGAQDECIELLDKVVRNFLNFFQNTIDKH